MNSITVAGNLGQDAELKTTKDGETMLKFSVADKLFAKQGEDPGVQWFNCTLFGKRGTKLAEFLKKGTPVTVVGSFEMRTYEIQGEYKKSLDVRVSEVALQGGKREGGPPAASAAPAAMGAGEKEDEY